MPRSVWPPHQTLKPLIHRHLGRPGVVMGGGLSLSEGMAAAPRDAIYVSANDHGVRWLADHPQDGRRCSYVVACDKIEKRARVDVRPNKGGEWGVPVISRHMWGDYRLLHMPGRLTGQVAAWCLRAMGCSPIILLGMDLYDGATYYDAPQAHSTGRSQSARTHLSYWHSFWKSYPGMYRVIGCHKLLQELLGVYDPREPVLTAPPAEKLEKELEAHTVRIIRQATIRMRLFQAGEVLDVSQSELRELLLARKAIVVRS